MLKRTIVDLGYVDSFDYKFLIITKINLFKGYTIITHVDNADLIYATH